MHTITIGIIILIGSFSQAKQVINTSKQHIISVIKLESTEYSLNLKNKIKYTHNGLFFSYKNSESIDLFNLPPLPDKRR